MGGEKAFCAALTAASVGSPPRGRGKGAGFPALPQGQGITPAWAGKSSWTKAISTRTLDHPRMGGEMQTRKGTAPGRPGSPPRGRGKEDQKAAGQRFDGITPAWAGKRGPRKFLSVQAQDHPRVGGEKLWVSCYDVVARGSPPRWRGKVVGADSLLRETGITPAGRGKELVPTRVFGFKRITPAWAGKSFAVSGSARCARDHPRVGGEKNNGSCDLSIV